MKIKYAQNITVHCPQCRTKSVFFYQAPYLWCLFCLWDRGPKPEDSFSPRLDMANITAKKLAETMRDFADKIKGLSRRV